jgi:hypothetical protein
MKMKLIIETEIDPVAGSATFDYIANDQELRDLAGDQFGAASEIAASQIASRLRAFATDILVHGRHV